MLVLFSKTGFIKTTYINSSKQI